MGLLDDVKRFFTSEPAYRQGDLVQEVKQLNPSIGHMEDQEVANFLLAKHPDKYPFLAAYNPDSSVPAEFVPKSKRGNRFYEENPEEGVKDAQAVLSLARESDPRYAKVADDVLAAAIERQFPDRHTGLTARLLAPVVEDEPEIETSRRTVGPGFPGFKEPKLKTGLTEGTAAPQGEPPPGTFELPKLGESLKKLLIDDPEASAPAVREFLADMLSGTMAGDPATRTTRAAIEAQARKTGKAPISDIINRTLGETVAELIPLTPIEIVTFATISKAAGMGLSAFAKTRLGQAALKEIPRVLKQYVKEAKLLVTTKKAKKPIGAQEVRDFFTFGKDKLSPEVHDLLLKVPKENLVAAIKARQGVSVDVRVPRFGGKRAPTGEAGAQAPAPSGGGFPPPAPIKGEGPEVIPSVRADIKEVNLPPKPKAAPPAEPVEVSGVSKRVTKAMETRTAKGLPKLQSTDIVSRVEVGEGEVVAIRHQDVIDEATVLMEQANLERGESAELEKFVLSTKIKRPPADPQTGKIPEAEEDLAIPVRFKSSKGSSLDDVAQNAFDAGFISEPSGDLLRQELANIAVRGEAPKIDQFYDQALRELEFDATEGSFAVAPAPGVGGSATLPFSRGGKKLEDFEAGAGIQADLFGQPIKGTVPPKAPDQPTLFDPQAKPQFQVPKQAGVEVPKELPPAKQIEIESAPILDREVVPTPSGQAATGAAPLDNFELQIDPMTQPARREFKVFDEVRKMIDKYALRVGERYLPKGAAGVFFPETSDIRLKSMNNLSVASHEITHFLDSQYGISDQILRVVGQTRDGNPIYAPTTFKTRKRLTDLYVEYYPTGKANHPAKKRVVEGIATLFQKFVESPTTMKQKYPDLVNDFIQPGGRYHKKIFDEFLSDLQGIVKEFQKLSDLDKVGSRVTSKFQQDNIKTSYLNLQDRLIQEFVDNVYPIEKLAKGAGVQRTAADPSLWVRQYNNVNTMILQNVKGKRGMWSLENGEFKKVSDRNINDLISDVQSKGITDEFGYFLVARRQHFAYQELDILKDDALKAVRELEQGEGLSKTQIAERQRTIELFKRLRTTLKNDNFKRETIDSAYAQNRERFEAPTVLFDNLQRANLRILKESGLISERQFIEMSTREGYASFKRDVYDQIIGAEEGHLPAGRGGKTKVSSTMSRRGSELTILNPLYSLARDHAEIMRKSMKQIVINKVTDIAGEFPELFQVLELKTAIDPRTGVISFPQEKDPNIMMSRSGGKRKPFLVSKEIKNVVDELLTPQNVHELERWIRNMSRFFSKGTTGNYPLFAPTNFLIDQISASAQTRNKYIPIYDALANMTKVMFKRQSEEATLLQEYLALGGERQTFLKWQDLPPDQLFKNIIGEKTALNKIVDGLLAAEDIIGIPSQASEIATRGAEYIKSRKAGNPQVVAMEDAGRVSVPFHHIGRLGGGTAGATAVKSIPFFNPGIQVLAQFSRAVGDKTTRNRALFVTAAVMASMVGTSAFIMFNASEEQKDLYQDLEPGELANYIWAPHPDKKRLMKFRVPEQMGVLATLFNMALAETKLDARYEMGDYIAGATAFLPDPVNVTDPIRAFFSAIPQAIKPLIHSLANFKDWPKLRPMVSRGLSLREPQFQFHQNTSKFAKWLGQKFDLSPIKIDYLIEGYLGRTTRFITQKPISNPFVREYYFTSGRNLSDFYEMREASNQLWESYRKDRRQFSREDQNAILDQNRQVKIIDRLLKRYRSFERDEVIDVKDQNRALQSLRSEILDEISAFRQVVKVK